ncbi:MAG: YggU family protein [Betaproteobacteria bacterium]|nr:YggU family protein [Betaproteobacteria bacterium]
MLSLHIQPGAKRSAVAGLHDGALKIRIAAPPVEGRANEALIAFIAAALGVTRRSVSVVRGESARRKTVLVAAPGIDPGALLGPLRGR